ncbi:hypothetical protein ABIE13_002645 [Ottowia thiooxydans]|uniref:Uncharacterized protein n=1 Tax=Ottowia thiooxydans TaxID=219182 RepID=A0ABV2Q908_9BURK
MSAMALSAATGVFNACVHDGFRTTYVEPLKQAGIKKAHRICISGWASLQRKASRPHVWHLPFSAPRFELIQPMIKRGCAVSAFDIKLPAPVQT